MRIFVAVVLSHAVFSWAYAFDADATQAALDAGDSASAVAVLEQAATEDGVAARMLASLYHRGEGVPKDLSKALDLYRRAADLGDAEAQFNLGNIYLLGEGIPADEAWALTYYRAAAKQGHALARRNMNQLYRAAGIEPPRFVATDTEESADSQAVEEAEPELTSADEPGVVTAPPVVEEPLAPTMSLGETDDDSSEANAAAEAPGNEKIAASPEAADAAVVATEQEPEAVASAKPAVQAEVETTDAAAEEVAEQPELTDDERAAIQLAQEHGVSVALPPAQAALVAGDPQTQQLRQAIAMLPNDTAGSVAIIKALAENDFGPAQYEMARLNLAGQGMPQDVPRAVSWLQKSADLGHPQAQFDLGNRFLIGAGVEPDDAMGITWLRRAAQSGHPEAKQKLTVIYEDAGLPMPDLKRPSMRAPETSVRVAATPTAASPARAETAAQTAPVSANEPVTSAQRAVEPVAESIEQAAAIEQSTAAVTTNEEVVTEEAVQLTGRPSAQSVVAEASEPEVTSSPVAANANDLSDNPRAEQQPPEPQPYVESRYEYAVVQHTDDDVRKEDLSEIDPAKPNDHEVIAGGSLAQSARPITVVTPEPVAEAAVEHGIADDIVEAVPEEAAEAVTETQTEIESVVAAKEAPVETLEPVVASVTASASGNDAAGSQATAAEDGEVSAETELSDSADEATVTEFERRGAGSIDRDVAATATVAGAAESAVEKRRNFFGRIADALSSESDAGAQFQSRAPGAAVQSNETEGAVEESHKLALAENAEPDPIVAAPTLEQAKAALDAQDFPTAARMFRQLAEAGDAEAQAHYGYMVYQGEGVDRDKAESVRWYRKSAVQGNRDAQYNLAVAYAFGEGVPQDDAEAVTWYRRAAEQGSAIAQYSLGVSYALGEGVDADDQAAARWYRAAAEQGYPAAQYNLAYMYRAGKGIEQNDGEALRWFQQAAQNGHASAQYSLGYMYRSGKGVTRDIDEAIRWYRQAAAQGHPEARADLASLVPDR